MQIFLPNQTAPEAMFFIGFSKPNRKFFEKKQREFSLLTKVEQPNAAEKVIINFNLFFLFFIFFLKTKAHELKNNASSSYNVTCNVSLLPLSSKPCCLNWKGVCFPFLLFLQLSLIPRKHNCYNAHKKWLYFQKLVIMIIVALPYESWVGLLCYTQTKKQEKNKEIALFFSFEEFMWSSNAGIQYLITH